MIRSDVVADAPDRAEDRDRIALTDVAAPVVSEKDLLARARVAMDQGGWADALAGWTRLCAIQPGNVSYRLSQGEALLQLGRLEAAAALFEDVERADPRNIGALVGLINVADATLDRAASLALLLRSIELHPGASRAIRKAVTLMTELGRTDDAEALLARCAPQMTPVDRLFASAAILKDDRGPLLLSLIEAQADLVAQDEPLRDDLLPVLLDLGTVETAVAIWLGPAPTPSRQARGRAILAMRGTDWNDGKRVRLLSDVWKTCGFSAFQVEEFPFVCSAVADSEGTPAVLAMLGEIERRPPQVAVDIKLKMLAVLERAALGAMIDPRQAIGDLVARCDPRIPLGHLPKTMARLIAAFDRTETNFSAVHLETSLYRDSACAVLEQIIDHIERRRPMSYIRLGDGEGMFLPYPKEYQQFSQADRDAVQTRWWGTPRLSAADGDLIAADLIGVVQRADIVGIYDFQYWCQAIPVPLIAPLHKYNHFFRGLLSVLDHVATRSEAGRAAPGGEGTQVLTSALLPFDLETHDLYGRLSAVVRHASLITCHARLAPYIHDRWGVTIDDVTLVPHHAKQNAAFGYEPPAAAHYPQVFDRLRHKLAEQSLKGHVTLVAAGFLGKFYCDWIKTAGGIAIDIGSVADYWCGFSTRNPGQSRVRRPPSPSDAIG